ncbi:hypothetical protein DRH14_03190 [Candidatus Shapirobacteria bacterium]|nr:MAG: hypothetical protein DRH14_03190 [Candidatus Shapirobacteria bacterium]
MSSYVSQQLVVENSSNFYAPAPTRISTPDFSPAPSSSPTSSPTPTQTQFKDYSSPQDNFRVKYLSQRKLYKDNGGPSRRYIFSDDSRNNFVIHVGNDWSWIYPSRHFDSDFRLGAQDTFRYDTKSQTIFDTEYQGLKYTVQCVHNDSVDLKKECINFSKSFHFIDLD